MSRSIEAPERANDPLTPTDLPAFFARVEKPDVAEHRIGTEFETFGVHVGTADAPAELPTPVRFHDHVEPTLRALMDRHGWQPGNTRGEGGEFVELVRGSASITLEPGGQIELSGAPLQDIHETCAEFTSHYRELHDVSQDLGLAWMAVGYQPWATRDEIDWVPKARYEVMRKYLPTRGKRALDMMIRTCTVQANFDYSDERECGERFRLALAVGPLVTAMFANSPYQEGKATGLCSERTDVWFDVDPDRCGVPAFMFDGEPYSHQRYVDWALGIPMFFVEREGVFHENHDTFAEYMDRGLTLQDGTVLRATRGDWALHMSTLFPEVRLKPFIEVRTADAVPSKFVCALPALWKGILYDDDALAEAHELVDNMGYVDLLDMWVEARQIGVRSPRIHALCRRLLAAARGGLERQNVLDSKGRTEARFLDSLDELCARATCPANEAIEAMGPEPGRDAEARREFVRQFYFAGVEV